MKIFERLINSFDNTNEGFSARKLTAFALMGCIAYIHYKFVNDQNAIEALIIDLCGVFLALGLVTFSQLIELKNGKSNDTTN